MRIILGTICLFLAINILIYFTAPHYSFKIATVIFSILGLLGLGTYLITSDIK